MKRYLSMVLAIMMAITFLPINGLVVHAIDEDMITITDITPSKVSATSGKVVTLTGTNFGLDKGVTPSVTYDGVGTTDTPEIISVSGNQMVIKLQPGTVGKAYLNIERTGYGSASIPFEYVVDPTISKIMTNTEITIYRDNSGEVIKNPDGTAKRDKKTFVEIYGVFNFSETNEIEQNVLFHGETPVSGTVVEQKSGYIKVSLPDHFVFNKEYDITIDNKYGGQATFVDTVISVAKHDITQLSTLRVSIGDKLGISGTNFPTDNLEVRLVNTSGEDTAATTSKTLSNIEITVPQVATAGYQKVKVIDTSNATNNTAVTFVDSLLVLPKPAEFTVTAVSPNAGPVGGKTEVRLMGKGLNPDMKVKFGNNYATNVALDTEMSVGDMTVLKMLTPPSASAGPVNITIENPMDNGLKVFSGMFRYTEVDNSLVFIDLNPTEGFETGGTTVTLTGVNFQRTKKGMNQTVSDESDFELKSEEGETNSVLSLIKYDIADYQIPGTGELATVDRVRELRVYFGGRKAEIVTIRQGNEEGIFQDLATIINPETGQQEMTVRTPQIALDPRRDTPVDVEMEILTKYYRAGTTEIVDQYTEKASSSRKFTYKPVPSAPELLAVNNERLDASPTVPSDPSIILDMAKGPASNTVYIYGLDFRPDAKVYFFKEANKPINEYIVPKNQGQVVSVDSLGYSLKNKLVYRIEVVVPNIQELGEVTVLVQNGDKGRTKTLNEFINEGSKTDNELTIRQYDYLSTPIIDRITPEFGSTTTTERPEHRPVAMIIGKMFLVDNMQYEDGRTELLNPTVYLVPRSTLTQDIVSNIGAPEYDKYKADILEVIAEQGGKIISLDGVRNRIGTKISLKLPEVEPSEKGYRDIVIINPDGGIARLVNAFEYMEPKKQPEIISVLPDKGSIDGGQKVVITGKGFDYDIREILVTVTIGGEIVKIDKVERAPSGDNIVLISITTPKNTEGEKILQAINNNDGGTGESTYTYTRVSTNPRISSITPKHGGPYTQVIIKGDDFVLPNPNVSDIYDKAGTRVLFNEHELNIITTSKELDDGTTVTSSVYVTDKNTIILTLPDNLPLGLKDVTIINPDTTRVTVKNGFTYLSPKSEPKIDSITPSEGTRDGGTKVVIIGEDFREDNIEVYFGEKKGIVEKVQEIEGNKYKLLVTTPNYPVDEKITDRVPVSVTVINSDGGSVTKKDGFTFRVPGSFPKITTIDPKEGSTAGYETVVINGDDFRFDDKNKNGKPDGEGEEKEALPKVYFGWEEAIDVQYSSYGVLIVKTPSQENEGPVDVTITNPDAGTIVLKNGFTYRKSKPTITSITPDTVTKFGGTEITVVGTGFIEGRGVGDQTGQDLPQDPGDNKAPIYGLNIDVEVIIGDEEASSKITGRYAEVNIGGIKVTYDNRDVSDSNKVRVKYKDDPEIEFKLNPQQSRIVLLQTGTGTKGIEGVKISIKDNTLIVTRGLAPAVRYVDTNTLIVTTPAVENTGTKSVRIVNRDNGTAKGSIIIKNPDSKPEITNIEPKREIYNAVNSEKVDYYATESTIDGGLTFTIIGKDFRKGVRVFIGNQEAEIISKNNEETQLIVRSPKGRDIDVNKPLRIVVINEDGESADSALSKIGDAQAPAYYIYRPKESDPTIESVTPNRGSIAGGDIIRILGNDFRIEDITVRIGAREATVITKDSSYKELIVVTPQGDILGPVDIFIRNEAALGEVVLRNGFTYYSNPSITSVTPNEAHNTGGQKVTIRGNMFLQGIKVLIGDTPATEIKLIDDRTIEITTPPGELGPKDVKIENTDGGSYTLKNGITYVVPVPEGPTGLVAYPGNERSITLRWDKAEGAHRYKIFGTTNTRDGYEFIAETESLEYILRNLKPNTRYYFRLWALNKYGESIDYDYTWTTTLKSKDDDEDHKYDETESTTTVVNYTNSIISVDLPKDYRGNQYSLDFTDAKYNKYEKIRIVVPMSAISYSSGGVFVSTKDTSLYISMYDLMYSTYFTASRNEKDANVIVTLSKLNSTEKARLTKGLTRKEKALSDGFDISLELQRQKNIEAIKITNGINISFIVEQKDLDKDNLYLAKYNSKDNKLEKVSSSTTYNYDISREAYIHRVSSQIEENAKLIVIYKE
ncbi:MAG: IPT/TIG domain-containing protein [Tissierellales bacterium]